MRRGSLLKGARGFVCAVVRIASHDSTAAPVHLAQCKQVSAAGSMLRGSGQEWASCSLVWREGERAMWFGSMPRMNAALSATQMLMSVPGDISLPSALLFRFGLLFLPGGQRPSRTSLSRFGLSRTPL